MPHLQVFVTSAKKGIVAEYFLKEHQLAPTATGHFF